MYDNDDEEKKEKRQVRYEDVDAEEAGWDPLIVFRSRYRYRIFFENDIGLKNGLQLDLLRGYLEDKCGVEGQDWELRESPVQMEDFWNKGRTNTPEEIEARLWGNSVYLTDMAWLIGDRLMNEANDPVAEAAEKHTMGRLTVVQTRR